MKTALSANTGRNGKLAATPGRRWGFAVAHPWARVLRSMRAFGGGVMLLGLFLIACSGRVGTDTGQTPAAPRDGVATVATVGENDPAPPPAPDGYVTVNVTITDGGIQPASVLIPAERTIKLILRNQTAEERHYQVVGLTPIHPAWLSRAIKETADGEEHENHHETPSFVDSDLALLTMCNSAAGVCPTPGEVHLYADGGGLDAMFFTAPRSGTFRVQDPLHPEIIGQMTVYAEGLAAREASPSPEVLPAGTEARNSLKTAAMVRELIPFLTREGRGPEGSELEVMYESPLLFELTGRVAPETNSGGIGISFTVTESRHDTDLPEGSPDLVLTVDSRGPFAPVRVKALNSDDHHRTTHYLFPSKDGQGQRLIKGGHQVLALSLALDECGPRGAADDSGLVWHMPISPSTPSGTLTPVSLDDARVVQVNGRDSGFEPASLSLVKGQRVILVFQNTGTGEHHFHAREMPARDLLWLSSQEAGIMPADIEGLRSALFLPYHVCDSESGICPTGIDVHLHARAGGWLAVSFVPSSAGTFPMTSPLHPEMRGTIVVSEK